VLPGRPQTVSREITLPDAKVQVSMTSTGIGATLFAVGAAELPSGLSAICRRDNERLRICAMRWCAT
jgi:hypothetical protein